MLLFCLLAVLADGALFEKNRLDNPDRDDPVVGDGGDESPMAFDLAALNAMPPRVFIPLNTLPPTLRAAFPISLWVTPPMPPPNVERGSPTACDMVPESEEGAGDEYARNLPDRAYTG